MSQLCQEHQALNMAQGFPDFNCSDKLTDLVSLYMKKGFNQYAPMPGILSLRERISEKTFELYKAAYDPATEITLTCGATEACFSAITAIINKGDEVIIFEPAFDVYAPVIALNGGVPVYVELDYPDYRIDWQEVKGKISPRTKLIIINSPHNPTGSVLEDRDLKALINLVKDTDILILSDEVYEHILFDHILHASVLNYPALKERCVIVSSFGKTFHTTGWRMGYCLAPSDITKEIRKIHQFNTFSVPAPMQYAVADFLKEKENYLGLSAFYQKKRDLFINCIKDSKFSLVSSKGTFFQLLCYKNLSEEKDTDFAARLVKEKGIASIPISVFYSSGKDDKVLRFCFAKEESTLQKAGEILCSL